MVSKLPFIFHVMYQYSLISYKLIKRNMYSFPVKLVLIYLQKHQSKYVSISMK